MNIEELMIGDLVVIIEDTSRTAAIMKTFYGKIVSLDLLKDTVGIEYVYYDNKGAQQTGHMKCKSERVLPMNLRKEYLTHLGFGFVESSKEYRDCGGVWTGYWILEGLELGVANTNHIGDWPCYINIEDSNIKCEYVHQLQHAMKMCNIKREFELY